MHRRQFLTYTGLGVAAIAGGLGIWLSNAKGTSMSLSVMRTKLDEMRGKTLVSKGIWSPGQVFTHLAQSIEYSMTGYPQMRSELFQKTVGSIAFAVFSEHGSMTHPLDEPIPGAPLLAPDLGQEEGLVRLISAIDRFTHHTAALYPHFAYGALNQDEYLAAHLMHIDNHLEEIQLA